MDKRRLTQVHQDPDTDLVRASICLCWGCLPRRRCCASGIPCADEVTALTRTRRRGKKPQDWRRPLWVSQGGSSSRFESTPCHRGLRWHGRWPGTASAPRKADMRHLQNAAAPGVRRQGTGVTECSADGPCTNDEKPEACNDRRKRQDGGCLGVIQALGLSDKVQRNSPASNAAASDNEWGKQKCPIPAAQGYEPVLWSGVCAMSFGMRRVSLGSETQGDIQERSSTHFDREPTPSSLPKGSH